MGLHEKPPFEGFSHNKESLMVNKLGISGIQNYQNVEKIRNDNIFLKKGISGSARSKDRIIVLKVVL